MSNDQPLAVVERLIAAINAHDLEAFLACFAHDYQSVQPLHLDRAFQGREQVRRNWSAIFAGMPDLHWEVLRSAVDDRIVWIEVRAGGTRRSDGVRIALGGVLINEVQHGVITSARIYFEEILDIGEGITASVTELYAPPGTTNC